MIITIRKLQAAGLKSKIMTEASLLQTFYDSKGTFNFIAKICYRKRFILTLLFCLFSFFSNAQTTKGEHLKAIQPDMAVLMMQEIRLNPNDTAFQKTKFDNLPVKFTPFFVMDSRAKIYTRAEMDSIINRIHYLFYEKESP